MPLINGTGLASLIDYTSERRVRLCLLRKISQDVKFKNRRNFYDTN